MKKNLLWIVTALLLPAATFAKEPLQINEAAAAQVKPGVTTKAGVQAILGAPWRIAQFNDCGHAPPGQADETWDYRGADRGGTYRLHIEFDDRGVTRLIAKIPDHVPGGAGTEAKLAPGDKGAEKMAMKM
jgi:outer membrane protein assembly factor BamE (lipoprotein component of BamABCDE complex)